MRGGVTSLNKSFKIRIYPSQEQIRLIEHTFGCVRYVYNYMLNLKQKLYKFFGINLSYNNSSKVLTELKRCNDWLCGIDSRSLQGCIKDLDSAYQRFFSGQGKYPKFKSKKRSKNSYRTNSIAVRLDIDGRTIKIPKVGIIRFRDKSKFSGVTKIYNITISKTTSGKYFASISAFSRGEKVKNPKFFIHAQKKLAKMQRKLSKKVYGSNNYQKYKVIVAKFREMVRNRRLDFLHKLTLRLVREYDIICCETLKVKNMMKNHTLAKSFQDTSLYEFIRQLEYKTRWYGKTLSKIDTFCPSSQLCSNCGYKNEDVKISKFVSGFVQSVVHITIEI